MNSLTTQTKNIDMVISIKDIPYYNIEPYIRRWCTDNCEIYAYILHDKDYDDNGVKKTKHVHVVCYLKKRQRLKQIITNIAELCELNINAISIDKANDLDSCIQYLIHKNDSNKYQYDIKDIKTNIEYDDLVDIIEEDNVTFNFDTIKNIALNCLDEKQYISKVWKWYGRYWRLLEKMWEWYGKRKGY